MPMPEIVVITDTSCLIALTKLGAIDILHKLYSEVIVTEEIAKEFGDPLPEWIQIKPVPNEKYQQLLEATLDKGESSAIALAIDLQEVLLIIDEIKGRREAKRLGLKITGTLGILLKAKEFGFIKEIKESLNQLETKGFRISPEVKNDILQQGGEL